MRTRNTLPASVRLLLLLPVLACLSCSATSVRRQVARPERYYTIDAHSPYLKVHFKDGRLAVLDDWKAFLNDSIITGHGSIYDVNRDLVHAGYDTIKFASVALFESNVVETGTIIPELSVISGLSLALSIYCLSNPKACFGSCPTFYAWDGDRYTLMAEGFSSSVLPVLEANDIDALYKAVPRSRQFELRITNEAYETHLIRSADLLVAKRPDGGRIVHMTDGSLREAFKLMPPAACRAAEGDILPAVVSLDSAERFSSADSNDLETKETISLRFEPPHEGKFGLTLGFRQTLMTTYLFYQGLAYLGDSAGAFLARIQSDPADFKDFLDPFGKIFGGIDVSIEDRQGRWHNVGNFYETGPIAHNVQTLAFPDSIEFSGNVRLRMTKGMWRLNLVALASLGKSVTPTRLKPKQVWKDSLLRPEEVAILQSGSGHVVSLPGDVRRLIYELPQDYSDLELFLDSRGYYLEWMRKEWLAETNPAMVATMMLDPESFLRMEAPKFKAVESSLENSFWSSKYVRHEH